MQEEGRVGRHHDVQDAIEGEELRPGGEGKLEKQMEGVEGKLAKQMEGVERTLDAKVAGVVATARAEAAAAAMTAVKDYGVSIAGGAASKT